MYSSILFWKELYIFLYMKNVLIFCNKIIWYLCALIVCHFPSDSWVLLYKMTPLPEPRLYWKRSSFPLNPSERKSPVPSCRGRFSLVQNRRPLSEYPRIFIWRLNCFPETLQVQNKDIGAKVFSHNWQKKSPFSNTSRTSLNKVEGA